jgi:hypothetical protein
MKKLQGNLQKRSRMSRSRSVEYEFYVIVPFHNTFMNCMQQTTSSYLSAKSDHGRSVSLNQFSGKKKVIYNGIFHNVYAVTLKVNMRES